MRLSAEDLMHHPWFKQMQAVEKKKKEENEWVKEESPNGLPIEETVTIEPNEGDINVEKPVSIDGQKEVVEIEEYKDSKEYGVKEEAKDRVQEEVKDRVQEEVKDRVQVNDEGKEVTKESISKEESKKKSKNLEEESESRQPESIQSINDKEGKSKLESDPEIKSFSKSIHSTPRHKLQPSPDPSDDKWISVSPPPNLTPLVFPTSMK